MQAIGVEGDWLHAECIGDIGLPTIREGKESLQGWLGSDVFSRRVLLGMDKVRSLDTVGIGWLLACQKEFKETGGMLVLHSVPPLVAQILDLLHLDRVLVVKPDLTAARAFSSGVKP